MIGPKVALELLFLVYSAEKPSNPGVEGVEAGDGRVEGRAGQASSGEVMTGAVEPTFAMMRLVDGCDDV